MSSTRRNIFIGEKFFCFVFVYLAVSRHFVYVSRHWLRWRFWDIRTHTNVRTSAVIINLRVSLEAAITIIEAPYSEVADSKLDIANEPPAVGRLIYSCTSEPDNSQLGRSTRLETINAHRIAFREYAILCFGKNNWVCQSSIGDRPSREYFAFSGCARDCAEPAYSVTSPSEIHRARV